MAAGAGKVVVSFVISILKVVSILAGWLARQRLIAASFGHR